MNRGMSLGIAFSVLLLLAGALRAEEVWTLHGFDYGLFRTRRLEMDLHTRFRTNQHMTNFQQGRSGAVLRWNAHRRFTPIGGYYFGQQEDGRDEWTNFHRVFGGGEALVYGSERMRLASRTLVERSLLRPILTSTDTGSDCDCLSTAGLAPISVANGSLTPRVT